MDFEEKRRREMKERAKKSREKARERRIESWNKEEKYNFIRETFPNKIGDNLLSLDIDINENLIDKSLYLYGSVGTGKTMFASKLALDAKEIKYINDNGHIFSVSFIMVPELLGMIKETFNSDNIYKETGFSTHEKIIQHYINQSLVILDDLGAEKQSDFVLETLLRIIVGRDQARRQTIITSNLDLNELAETSGYMCRIPSKIREAVDNNIIYFGKKDLRIK